MIEPHLSFFFISNKINRKYFLIKTYGCFLSLLLLKCVLLFNYSCTFVYKQHVDCLYYQQKTCIHFFYVSLVICFNKVFRPKFDIIIHLIHHLQYVFSVEKKNTHTKYWIFILYYKKFPFLGVCILCLNEKYKPKTLN